MSSKKFNLQRKATKEKGEQAMENNKGITLVSLIGYVILSMLVISILTVITANFRKNFNELDVQAVQDIEFDKINMQISKEIREGKELDIDNVMANEIAFIEGNKYTYVSNEKALYMNDKVVIAEHLTNCSFSIENNEILRVMAQIEGKNRVMEYALVNKYVARIKDEYYVTLQSAIDAVPSNDTETTITVLTDVTETISINEKQNIILNIGAHKITNNEEKPVITLSGKLRIDNGTVTSIVNSPTIYIKEQGALVISGGTISGTNSQVINNYGNMHIKDFAKITSYNKAAIYNRAGGTGVITGGKITSEKSNAIVNYANLEISEIAYISNNSNTYPVISNQQGGIIKVTGGTIKAINVHAINNHSTLEISGNAHIESTSTNQATIYNQIESTVKITGGIITATVSNTINNFGILEISGTTQILGMANVATLYNQKNAIVTILGGVITSENSYAIYNEGKATVSGATINGETFGI